MITREQYETAKSVLLEYQSQLRVEAEYIGGILSKDVDAVSTASFLSELEAGDKCIISAIQRHKPSLKKGDVMKVLTIEKKYRNGHFSCKVWLKNENIPGLAMSRSIGDKIAQQAGVICEPGIF